MRPLIFAAASLALLPLLAGCSKGGDERLYGTWFLDRAYTESHLSPELIPSPDAPPFSMPGLPHGERSAKSWLVGLFLDQLGALQMTITREQISGAGRSLSYEIVAREKNSWILKTQDGKLESYAIVDDRLALTSTGDVQFTIYFARARN